MIRVPAACINGIFDDGKGTQSPTIFYGDAYIWDQCACGAIRAGNMYNRDMGNATIMRVHTMPPDKEGDDDTVRQG